MLSEKMTPQTSEAFRAVRLTSFPPMDDFPTMVIGPDQAAASGAATTVRKPLLLSPLNTSGEAVTPGGKPSIVTTISPSKPSCLGAITR